MYKPMLAKEGEPFDSPDYIFEIKWDGTRVLVYVGDKIRFINRRGFDIRFRYPEIDIKKAVKKPCVLDGEIVILEKGKPNFYKLQEREQTSNLQKIDILSKTNPATLILFDILELEGKQVLNLPLMERKRILSEVAKNEDHVIINEWIDTYGKELFERVKKLGLEGIIAKKKDSLYIQGRSNYWLKIKTYKSMDAIILGYTKGKGKRKKYFGSLVLGAYKNGELVCLGKVGTGFDEKTMKYILKILEKGECAIKNPNCNGEEIIWVKPKVVCEVKYLELTPNLELRAPVFLRIRFDKDPQDCKIEF